MKNIIFAVFLGLFTVNANAYREIKTSDISRIEESEKERVTVMSEIDNTKDKKRMTQLLNILIKDTETLDEDKKDYYRGIMYQIQFKQALRLTDILTLERRKIAGLYKEKIISDISRIEESEKEQATVISELKNTKDKKRMMYLLKVLIKDAESMDEDEKEYYHVIMDALDFKSALRLTEILSVERRKLAILERKYQKSKK